MSEILKRIRDGLKLHMLNELRLRKEGDMRSGEYNHTIAHKTVARSIISMFPEIGVKPAESTDDDVIKLLKKYIKNEKERLLYYDKHITESDVAGLNPSQVRTMILKKFQELGDSLTSTKVLIAQGYLPKQASEEEIAAWIHENIDFSIYKNKMQAMKPITNHFKGCDGNFVKNLLIELS